MPQSRYFQINPIRRRQDTTSDVDRGLQVGQEVGKLLGGLAGAIKGAQKDALANKLMNTEDAPRAALVSPGGQWQTSSGDQGDSGTPQTQDLGTVPLQQDTSFTNPATGNIEPLQGQAPPSGASDADLQQAIAAARLTSSANAPTAGSFSDAPPTPAVPPAGTRTWVPNAPVDASQVPTSGSAPHTGGVQEMDLQKEILAQQLQKASLASAKARAADEAAQMAGTGRYGLEGAKTRLEMENIQSQIEARKAKAGKPDKDASPVDITNEPVTNQEQLNKFVDSNYGNGASTTLLSQVADGTRDVTADDKGNPTGAVPLTLSKNKTINMPVADAARYVKQANVLRRKQNLSLFRVPGEDLNIGHTADNPYPVFNKVDALSRPPGTFIRLPNRQVVKVQ